MEKKTEKIKITPFAQQVFTERKKELEKFLSQKRKPGEEVVLAQREDQLAELNKVLENAEVIEFSESTPALVIIGAKIILENLRNGDKREYVILTRGTSDPLKGVISNESPLAQKMLNLKLGNTFKFKDLAGVEESYKIASIE